MSYSDWNSSPTSSSRKPHAGYVCMSTVDDLSYTPSAEEKTRDAAQIVATGRRSWKTLKGKGEAVWPPHLEAALIEALEKYKPDDSRSSKTLGRFSMRNRFISDFIFETTGKRRTPKQVGSRLQQLRDTCKSEKILQLICRRNMDTDGDSTTMSSGGNSPSTSPPPEKPTSYHRSPYRRSNIWVNVVLENLSWSSPAPVINIVNNERVMPLVLHLAALPSTSSASLNYDSLATPRLSNLDPTVTFVSPCPLTLQCSFSVFLDGTGLPIHTEVAPLKCHSSPIQSSGWMYSARLVPGLWKSLCESASPTRYTIMQNLFPARTTASSANFIDTANHEDHISVIYNFAYPESSTELPPQAYDMYSSNFSFLNNHESQPLTTPRNWYAPSSNDLDWTGSFGASAFSHTSSASYTSDSTTTSAAGYGVPTISRSGRSVGYQNDSWIAGQKYTHSALPVQYC